jgi:hypothetical protein
MKKVKFRFSIAFSSDKKKSFIGKLFNFSLFSFQFFQAKSDGESAKADESNGDGNLPNLKSVSQASSMRDGSDFHIIGELKNPHEIIKRSSDFESVIIVLQQLKCDEIFQPESHFTEQQRIKIAQRDADVAEMREKMAQLTAANAEKFLAEECCDLLKEIGPPWNWLHNFTSQTCREQSFNYIESIASDATLSSDESFDYVNEKFVSAATTSTADDGKSTTSAASAISISLSNFDEESPTNTHKVLIDAICSISEASDKGECNIRETASIAAFLNEQHSRNQLKPVDYERLIAFIRRAQERALVFNDLNELYNYFIQEASRERAAATHAVEIREEDEDEAEQENIIDSTDEKIQPDECENAESKNVVAIFGESGIEVDGKLLDAKVSERMILGLVDKPPQFEDNVSDVASSISSLSQAETVKQNVTREKDTQTTSFKEQIHSNRMQSKHVGKSKSASSIKRQPFACKIPQIPGIGPSMDGEKLEKILRFLAHRSFQQGGFVYPRNFLEDECPNLT